MNATRLLATVPIGLHVQRVKQRHQRDRFAQELIEARINGSHSIVQARAASDGDDAHAEECGVLPQTSRGAETVESRHVEIEQCCVRFDTATELHGFDAISTGIDVDAGRGEHLRNGGPEEVIVFCVNHFAFAGGEQHEISLRQVNVHMPSY